MEEYLALEGGPPGFGPGCTCPDLLGYPRTREGGFRLPGSHRLRPAFPCRLATRLLSDRAPGGEPGVDKGPTTPRRQRFAAYTRRGLGFCAFARRYWRSLG